MSTMAIIGTAGRRDDRPRMTPDLWEKMLAYALCAIESWKPDTVVSGGAAWADHLAVELYRQKEVENLRLYLPAEFKNSKFVGPRDNYRHPGNIANYYHESMSRVLGRSTLREIQAAIDVGAEVHVIQGFKQRNTYVARADYLLAFTFGTHSGLYTPGQTGYADHHAAGLKDGGTADTWDKACSVIKEHKSLWTL